MCFLANPAPVTFIKCGHTVNVPTQATPVQCPQYLGTNQWHQTLQASTTTSSTNRINKCPPCLKKEREGKDKIGKKDTDKDKDKDKGGKQSIAGSSQRSVKVK